MTPGIKTSEFWLTLCVQVVALAAQTFSTIATPWAQTVVSVAGVLGSVLSVLGYTRSRTAVKVSSGGIP